jgi:hypothetical protein
MHEPLDDEDITGEYLGGDVQCSKCNLILAAVFKKKNTEGGEPRVDA